MTDDSLKIAAPDDPGMTVPDTDSVTDDLFATVSVHTRTSTPAPPPVPVVDGEEHSAVEAPLANNGKTRPPLVFSEHHPLPCRSDPPEPVRVPVKTEKRLRPHSSPVHVSKADLAPDFGFGDLLEQARKLAGFTVEQVCSFTKLSSAYVTALERSDLKHLPPPVYVAAYIRTLCALYHLDDEGCALVHEKLHSLPGHADVPSQLIQKLESDVLVNEDEARRVRKIFYFVASAAVVVAVLIAWAVVAMLRPASPEANDLAPKSVPALQSPSGVAKLAPGDFDSLLAPQIPETSVLQMSSTPGVKR